MSKVVSLMEYKEKRWSSTPRVAPRTVYKTEEEKEARVNHTREGLLTYLAARRERVGMTLQDARESPERVLEKQQIIDEQQALLADYLQTQESVDTM